MYSFKQQIYKQKVNTGTPGILYTGVCEVDDCLDTVGQNTLVDFTGNNIGDSLVLQGTATPFNGNSNWFILTGGGTNAFYNPITLPISNFIVQIDALGVIINKINC